MARFTLSGAALIAVTYGLARFALGLFVPELRDELELTSSGVGWMLSASFAGYLASLAVAGGLIRRVGTRATALLSGACAVVGTAGIAGASSVHLAATAAVVGGASTGWSSTAMANAVQAQIHPHQQPTAQTAINAGTSAGLIVAAAAATLVGNAWRLAWLVFCALAIVATFAATATVHPQGRSPSQPLSRSPVIEPIGPRLVATAAAVGGSSATFWAFAREQFVAAAALPPGSGRITWVALGVGGFLGAGAGGATRHYGLPATLATVWTAFALAQLLLATAPLTTTSAFLLTATIGAGYMALTGLIIVWAVRDQPTRPGAAVATAFLVLAIGQTVSSPVAGALAERSGLPAAFIAASLVALFGLSALPRSSPTESAPMASRHKGSQ